MPLVRRAGLDDLDGVANLLERAGYRLAGLTNLLGDRDRLASMLEASDEAFDTVLEDGPGGEEYLLVLESDAGEIVGTSGLIAGVGLRDAFYSYRVGTVVRASPRLGIHNRHQVLFLGNDQTGQSELCRLYLDPDHRGGGAGSLLSLSRFLLVATHPGRFGDTIFAELRGVLDEHGNSPFWDGLPSQFLSMSFSEADRLSGSGDKSYIAELMPTQPVYVRLLRPETQAVIGVTHAATVPARRLLEREGLSYRGYIDIFDGGPTVEASVAELRVNHEGGVGPAVIDPAAIAPAAPASGFGGAQTQTMLVSNLSLTDFRATTSPVVADDDAVRLDAETAAHLRVEVGDPVRWLPFPKR